MITGGQTPAQIMAQAPRHEDMAGNDITNFIVAVPAFEYDMTGRVTGGRFQASGFTEAEKRSGALLGYGEGYYEVATDQSPKWVDLSGPVPILKDRPVVTWNFDKLEIVPRQEATLRDIMPCVARFTGPVSGVQEQKTKGPFKIGFTTVGVYTIEMEPFPYMPVKFTLTVRSGVAVSLPPVDATVLL